MVIKEIGKCLVNCEKIIKFIFVNLRFLIYYSLYCVCEVLMVFKKFYNIVIKMVCKYKNVMIYVEIIKVCKWCVFIVIFFFNFNVGGGGEGSFKFLFLVICEVGG